MVAGMAMGPCQADDPEKFPVELLAAENEETFLLVRGFIAMLESDKNGATGRIHCRTECRNKACTRDKTMIHVKPQYLQVYRGGRHVPSWVTDQLNRVGRPESKRRSDAGDSPPLPGPKGPPPSEETARSAALTDGGARRLGMMASRAGFGTVAGEATAPLQGHSSQPPHLSSKRTEKDKEKTKRIGMLNENWKIKE